MRITYNYYYRSLSVIIGIFLFLAFTSRSNTQTWKALGLVGENITAIAVDPSPGSQIIYAGSDFRGATGGAIFKTSNGGLIWDTLRTRMNVHRIIINNSDPRTVYVNIGSIIKTTDAGDTWASADSGIQLPSFAEIGDFALDQKHPDTLYAVTHGIESRGGIYKSVNGGKYWSDIDTMVPWFWIPTGSGDSILGDPFADGSSAITIDPWNSNGLYIGTGGAAYLVKTLNGGETWSYAGLTDHMSLFGSIEFGLGSNEIFVSSLIGDDCHVYFSSDAGSTWKSVRSGGWMGTIQVQRSYSNFDTSVTVFVTEVVNENSGIVYESTDKGESWLNTGGTGNGTLCLFGSKLYAGGNGIMVADSPWKAITRIAKSYSPPSIFLLTQNYPNPFNPSTLIDYQLATDELVSVEIYDLLGKKIRTVVNEHQKAGAHSVIFNASGLSSGVYLYRLTAGSFINTKKLMVIK